MTIFVSIASYRDNQCQYTIADLFQKAKHPDRVVAGVCFQVTEDDDDSFLLDLSRWSNRIRTCFLHHTEAKGPCYARALIQKELFRGEDYYFQIDSHFRFVQDWDEICLEQLSRCNSPKPLLTTYASSYTLPKDYKPGDADVAVLSTSKAVTIICADTFGDQHRDDPFLRIKTRICRSDFGHNPPPALFWTARFAFSTGKVVAEVPYDPHLEYIFFGEEIAMSARLWTSGWDLFNPTRLIAYHLGSRAHRQWFREVQTSQEQLRREAAAKSRICGLLGIQWPSDNWHPAVPAPYGLGSARSLSDYERFTGVDFGNQTISERALNGGLSGNLFAPLWAEKERERMSHAAQMSDVASWAGKDNAGALQRQFPDRAAGAAPSPAGPQRAKGPEADADLEPARARVRALEAELRRARGEDARELEPELELELSRALAALGRAEAPRGGGARAGAPSPAPWSSRRPPGRARPGARRPRSSGAARRWRPAPRSRASAAAWRPRRASRRRSQPPPRRWPRRAAPAPSASRTTSWRPSTPCTSRPTTARAWSPSSPGSGASSQPCGRTRTGRRRRRSVPTPMAEFARASWSASC